MFMYYCAPIAWTSLVLLSCLNMVNKMYLPGVKDAFSIVSNSHQMVWTWPLMGHRNVVLLTVEYYPQVMSN